MTIDERFERIGHVTAGLAEQFRLEREENRQLWRGTQRQIEQTNAAVSRFAEETQRQIVELVEADRRLGGRIEALAEESRAADQRLGQRIESLVIAMAKVLDRLPGAEIN